MQNADVLIRNEGTREEQVDEKMFMFGGLKRDLRTIRLTTTSIVYNSYNLLGVCRSELGWSSIFQ